MQVKGKKNSDCQGKCRLQQSLSQPSRTKAADCASRTPTEEPRAHASALLR